MAFRSGSTLVCDPLRHDEPVAFPAWTPARLNNVEYAAAYNQVMAYGSINSSVRTADETASADSGPTSPEYLLSAGALEPDRGERGNVAAAVAALRGKALRKAYIAPDDAGISCWNTKNYYDFWRPVTAIRDGNSDGNPLTSATRPGRRFG